MKTKLKMLLSIAFIPLFFEACKPDKGCVDNNIYQYQLEEDLNLIPYKNFSELTFINKITRDTLVFIGEGYTFDWGKYTTQEECPQTYNLQRRYIVFNCTKNADKISIQNTFLQPNFRTISIGFKNKNINMSASGLSKPYSFDSLLIENKSYYNINEYPQLNLRILFNTTEGIVQIIHSETKDTLNLINIKL
jgi:hypothetical protein